jgi:glycosyltransferase involved in cell wall biosynthesis
MVEISVIIPAHNEESRIGDTLKAFEFGINTPHEIVVSIDHCTDRTKEIVEEFLKTHPAVRIVENIRHKGFGNAVRAGFEVAQGVFVVPIMADLCDEPNTIDKMYAKLMEGHDVVCGSRYMRGGRKYGGPIIQNIFSRLVSYSLKVFTGIPTWDAANSFKMYRRDFLEKIGHVVNNAGTEYSMYIIFRAYFAGGSIIEIPTTWRGRQTPFLQEFKIFKRTSGYAKAYGEAIKKLWKK